MTRRRFIDQIRHAVKTAGMSRYRLALESGVDETALSRFVRAERGLSMESIDAIADVLGLQVVVRPEGGGRHDCQQ